MAMCRSLLALVFVISACGKNNEPPPPSSGVPGAKPESGPKTGGPMGGGSTTGGAMSGDDRARSMFNQLCATCHGLTGEGNGQVAANLPVKPRNYTDAAWQASVTDDQIKEIILKGGQAVGKSPMMPANPDLASDPAKLDGLVKIVRGFKK
jgi:cytochrome c553